LGGDRYAYFRLYHLTSEAKTMMLETLHNLGAEYALQLLKSCCGLAESSCALVYAPRNHGIAHESCVQIVPQCFFEADLYGTVESLPQLPLQEISGIPFLFGSPVIDREGNRLLVYADLIASTYFMVTRYEEMVRREVRDQHGRFPGKESLAYRAGFLQRPIVEEYAALLRQWLREVGVDVPAPPRQFSLLLTHDIDSLRRVRHWWQPLRTAASALLGRRPARAVVEELAVVVGHKKDPLDTFEEIMALDDLPTVDRRSVYFIMGGHGGPYAGGYDLRDKALRRLLHTLSAAGVPVGLHASYAAGMEPQRLREEKAALEAACGSTVQANRHHFLCWREIEDGWELTRAGITWDSTLGYADVAGFRLGVCHPIPLFDPVRMQPMRIQEHPLIVMECTLDRQVYMGLGEEEAFEYCRVLMDATWKHGGEFVMLWHNDAFAVESSTYYLRLYQRLLRHADTLVHAPGVAH
jgi:hypothetical protein